MAASAIAIPTFGNGRALLATDLTGDVHALQVTTDEPDSAIAIWGFGSTKYVIGTVESDGIHTLCVTTDAPDSGMAVWGWQAQKYVLGTVESDGVHVLCVSTEEPDSAIAMPSFQSGRVILATVESDGVHVPVVTDAESGDAPFALWEWGNQKTIIAADTVGDGPAVVPVVVGMEPPYDPDAAAYFAAAGVTEEPYLSAINQFVLDLKAASIWTKFDRLWVLANQTSVAALTCLVSLNQDATLPVAPTFTAGEGFQGNGSSSYIDSGYAVGTDSVNLTQNSAAYIVYSNTDGADDGEELGTWQDGTFARGTQLQCRTAGGAAAAFVNQQGGSPLSVATANGTGLYVASRTASNAQKIYKNGAPITSNATASVVPSTHSVLLLVRGVGGFPSGSYSARQISLAGFASGFNDVEAAAFDTAVDTLKAAIGW